MLPELPDAALLKAPMMALAHRQDDDGAAAPKPSASSHSDRDLLVDLLSPHLRSGTPAASSGTSQHGLNVMAVV